MSNNPLKRKRITEPLALGIKSVDGFATVGKGQRLGIFAGSGVGKSTMLGMIARNSDADVNVVALIGDDEATLKRFFPEPSKGVVRLHPENSKLDDIIVENCVIQGVAVHVLKDLQ